MEHLQADHIHYGDLSGALGSAGEDRTLAFNGLVENFIKSVAFPMFFSWGNSGDFDNQSEKMLILLLNRSIPNVEKPKKHVIHECLFWKILF